MIELLEKMIEKQERVIEILYKQVANRDAIIAIYEGKSSSEQEEVE